MFIKMYEEKYMRFPEGRAKALTFSYDDGVQADIRLLQVFKKYGLKGTFNLNSKRFDAQVWNGHLDEEQTYNTFKDCGQEIGLHGARHVFLDKVPLPEAVKEVVDNREYLENKFERIVDGMAYAYSGYNDEVLKVLPALGVKYARTTLSTHNFGLPQDWLKWNPTCHHADPMLAELTDKFLNTAPDDVEKKREPWLLYIWGHSFEYDKADNWSVIEGLGERVAGREDIWFATNKQIYSYVTAWRALEFSLDGERVHNPSAIPVWLQLRGRTYKIAPDATIKF